MSQSDPSIVILTGAGISAESGIQTFRASDGLWNNHRVEDVATPAAFERDRALVQDFYNQRRQQVMSAAVVPNAAHLALASWEKQSGGDFLLVTQNIDNLHSRAGSKNLIHMHGELLKIRCVGCHQVQAIATDVSPETVCQSCQRTDCMRPHIVWFGEMPMQMDRIYDQLMRCNLFVSIGTSGNVYPAAGFVEIANQAGAETWELNLEPSRQQTAFQHARYGPASQVVPEFVQQWMDMPNP